MVSFSFNEENGCIEAKFIGEVHQNEIINFISELRINNDYPSNLKVLIDATNGMLILEPSQLSKIFDENVKMMGKYSSLRTALTMNRPKDTALAIIYTHLIKLERYKFQVFSTMNAAENWLNNGYNGRYRIYPPVPVVAN